ncbi:MAG: DUF3341 domain-containing protein [Deltaproteobacteria bacterium]|nr:MAG: DUF3341 domain-containing protein [Deltaproteobacteria bacterium]
MPKRKKIYGLLAEFPNPAALYHACEKVRDAGYAAWDAYSPFPVHGLEKAMGLGRSVVPWIVAIMGFSGAGLGFLMQWWMSAVDYPLIISAKPYNSYPAFVPVTFELGILLGSFGAVFGMFALNRLPQLYHSLFNSDRFAKVTDDGFFIAIEARDPNYDPVRTRTLLEEAGAIAVEEVED